MNFISQLVIGARIQILGLQKQTWNRVVYYILLQNRVDTIHLLVDTLTQRLVSLVVEHCHYWLILEDSVDLRLAREFARVKGVLYEISIHSKTRTNPYTTNIILVKQPCSLRNQNVVRQRNNYHRGERRIP